MNTPYRGPKRALPMLDEVRVASPCNAEWSEMLGDERVRFCLSCEKNVFNLSMMTRDDAEALLQERVGNDLCVRFYQRADGTILTQDCPEGVKKKRRKKLVLAVAGAGAMAAAAATMFMKETCTQGGIVPAVAGGAMYMGDPAPAQVEAPIMAVPPVAPIPTTAVAIDPVGGHWAAGGIGARPVDPPRPPRPNIKMGKPTLTMGKR